MKQALTFLLLLMLNLPSYGMGLDTIYIEEVGLKSTKSIPYVTNINHDHEGNLWISTLSGLYRYDGYDFAQYKSNENEDHGLIKDETYRTHLSNDGTIWIAGAYSIYQYDNHEDRLIRKSEDARLNNENLYDIVYFDIEDIDDRHLAVGTKSGLWVYNKSKQSFESQDVLVEEYKTDHFSSNAHVFQIERDPIEEQILWLLTKSGIYKYDCLTKKSELVYFDENLPFDLINERGSSFVATQDALYIHLNHKFLYKYDRITKKTIEIRQNNNQSTPQYIRNILPHDDGLLIVYIAQGIQQYNAASNKIIPIKNLYIDGSVCESLSSVGYDHEGRFSFIQNNINLCKSTERTKVRKLDQKIWTKNLKVGDNFVVDTIKDKMVHSLYPYQRKISFQFGLSNRALNSKETYYYRLNKSDAWIQLDENLIELDKLSAGNHDVFCKIVSNKNSFEKKVKAFYVKPYFYETTWFYTLILFGLIGLISVISYLVRIRKKDKKSYQKKMLELEMNALRSQMNPHFLFNSINSIKSYVISKDKDETAEYLTQFAKLIRMILENSRKKFLSLEEEIEMLKLYIIMEQKRLNYSFDFDIHTSETIDTNFLIAPMIIQPYVENAIWHGLMNKYGDHKKLNIKFDTHQDGVMVQIFDNGIGRKATQNLNAENKTSKKSLGLKITQDRIDIIKEMYKIEASVSIEDLYNEAGDSDGTLVKIFLPRIEYTS